MLNRLKVMWGELPLFSIGDLAQGKIFQYISRNICGQLYYECTIDEKMEKKTHE